MVVVVVVLLMVWQQMLLMLLLLLMVVIEMMMVVVVIEIEMMLLQMMGSVVLQVMQGGGGCCGRERVVIVITVQGVHCFGRIVVSWRRAITITTVVTRVITISVCNVVIVIVIVTNTIMANCCVRVFGHRDISSDDSQDAMATLSFSFFLLPELACDFDSNVFENTRSKRRPRGLRLNEHLRKRKLIGEFARMCRALAQVHTGCLCAAPNLVRARHRLLCVLCRSRPQLLC